MQYLPLQVVTPLGLLPLKWTIHGRLCSTIFGGIYRHFSTFYLAFTAIFTTALVCIFSGGTSIYYHSNTVS